MDGQREMASPQDADETSETASDLSQAIRKCEDKNGGTKGVTWGYAIGEMESCHVSKVRQEF